MALHKPLSEEMSIEQLLNVAHENLDNKNYKEAARLFRMAAEQGDARGQYNLGLIYEEGYGVEKDEKEAIRLYRLAADQGDAAAQFAMALVYEEGQGVVKDVKEAIRFYRLSVEQGYVKAQYNLALIYEKGKGVEKDEKEAIRLYRKAALQGDADAQYNLGLIYEDGELVVEDAKEAVHFYRLAALQGDADAQCALAVRYEEGKGVEKDIKEAARLYRLAANQGNVLAQLCLGVMYEAGRGVEKNVKEAVHFYRTAAERGDAAAQFAMGLAHEDGQGVEKDVKEAIRFYSMAAVQGYSRAQYNLALIYEEGKGVEKDAKEAVRLYRMAAEQGVEDAQYNLAVMFEEGQGIEKDTKEAFRLYRMAADQGDVNARFALTNKFFKNTQNTFFIDYYAILFFYKNNYNPELNFGSMQQRFTTNLIKELKESPESVFATVLQDEQKTILSLITPENHSIFKDHIYLQFRLMMTFMNDAVSLPSAITYLIVTYMIGIHPSWNNSIYSLASNKEDTNEMAKTHYQKGLLYVDSKQIVHALLYFNTAIQMESKLFPKIKETVIKKLTDPVLGPAAIPLLEQALNPETQLGSFLRKDMKQSRWNFLSRTMNKEFDEIRARLKILKKQAQPSRCFLVASHSRRPA